MKLKVAGKAHLEGVSKRTGKPYNFNQVHYLGKERGVEGYAACTLILDPVEYPIETLIVGADYDVEFNSRGYVVEFSRVGYSAPAAGVPVSAPSAPGAKK